MHGNEDDQSSLTTLSRNSGVISDDVLISEAHQQLAVEKTGIWCSSKLAHRLSGVKL